LSLSSCSEPIELLTTIQIGARQKYLTRYSEERTRLGSEAMDVTVLTGEALSDGSTLEGLDGSVQHFQGGRLLT
jgi:hypothetical protein